MAAPIDPAAAAALANNQSIIALAASMGVQPEFIFDPMRELPGCLIGVEEHVITLDLVPSPAPSSLHGPEDETSSYWIKVSSADELSKACAAAPDPLIKGKRLLHVHLLPSIPVDDVNTIDDWEGDADCSKVRVYITSRAILLCKLDAFASIDSIRETIKKSKDKIEDESLRLRVLAYKKSKEIEMLSKSLGAYVAVKDSKTQDDGLASIRDEAIIDSRPLIMAKLSHKALSEAADTTRLLVDSLDSQVEKLGDILQKTTLMGCGHPYDDSVAGLVEENGQGNQQQQQLPEDEGGEP